MEGPEPGQGRSPRESRWATRWTHRRESSSRTVMARVPSTEAMVPHLKNRHSRSLGAAASLDPAPGESASNRSRAEEGRGAGPQQPSARRPRQAGAQRGARAALWAAGAQPRTRLLGRRRPEPGLDPTRTCALSASRAGNVLGTRRPRSPTSEPGTHSPTGAAPEPDPATPLTGSWGGGELGGREAHMSCRQIHREIHKHAHMQTQRHTETETHP